MTMQNLRHGFTIGTAKRANKDTYAIEPMPGDVAGKSVTGLASTDVFTTSTPHSFAAGNQVAFSGIVGGAGLFAGTIYYVIAANLTANTFQVSTTSGGAAATFTTDMTAGTVSKLTIGMRRFVRSGDAVPYGWAVTAADQDDATTVDVKPAP